MTTAVLVCPGRGTYNTAELGTLARHFPDPALLARFDAKRVAAGGAPISALDRAARFSADEHGRGDNASGLIYAAGLGDALSLAPDIDIVAVTGNSMGWYTTLACAGAVSPEDGFDITTTMGGLMHAHGAGGQTLYPHMDPEWRFDRQAKDMLLTQVGKINAQQGHSLHLSIDLGGMLVLAGNDAGLDAFEAVIPPSGRFPMRLPGHAAFHSPLVAPISRMALSHFEGDRFQQPHLPMIDGRGHIWWPHASDLTALHAYTFGHQVTEPYDFTHALGIAAREFAPDLFIIVGPGTTLGGAVAQSLIIAQWRGITSKADFQETQAKDPFLVSMGRKDQRHLATTP